jgi:2-phospho-L-lactate guanylyltransferase
MKRPQFVVLLPVKAPALGKSRLRVPEHLRPGLATAFALDALHAARSTPEVVEVVVVTSDPGFATTCAALGVSSLPDADGGLNASLVAAAAAVAVRRPAAVPAALCADLPCLRPDDLSGALAQVTGAGAWFVADAEGTGTTMYAAPYDVFDPRFGAASRAAHRAAGATAVIGDLPSLRRDVDDEATLVEAMRLGPGPITRKALALLP